MLLRDRAIENLKRMGPTPRVIPLGVASYPVVAQLGAAGHWRKICSNPS